VKSAVGVTKPKREKVKKRWEEGVWADIFRKKKKKNEGTQVSDNMAATWW
jgi:hypothetical protein